MSDGGPHGVHPLTRYAGVRHRHSYPLLFRLHEGGGATAVASLVATGLSPDVSCVVRAYWRTTLGAAAYRNSFGPCPSEKSWPITIRAAHWVAEEAIGKLYSDLKSRMGPSPTTSQRRLALFRLVAQHSSGITEHLVYGLDTPPWRTLFAAWNEEYPPAHEWHYRDVRNFRRDFAEASRALIGY